VGEIQPDDGAEAQCQLAVLLSDGIMRVGLTLGPGRSLMHGVAPQCAVE
jgi:hypothetical protein